MKHLLIVSFLILFFRLNAQIEHVQIVKKSNPLVPNISGYSEGNIPYYLLCDSLGIRSSGGFIVNEFTISYRGEEYKIKGNTIPDSICVYIGSCKFEQIVFFNEIYAVNKKNEVIRMYPFNLKAVKNEN